MDLVYQVRDQVEQIIKECKKYNKFAQKLLYELYASQMTGICYRYIGNIDITKDVVQDGFLKIFANINKYNGSGSFEGWMKRIFINTAISYLRKHKNKHKHLNIDDVNETKIDSEVNHDNLLSDFESDHDFSQSGFDLVSSADFSEAELIEILEEIPEKYRLVFNLYCIEEYKHEEIAILLGIEVSTSRSRLNRARTIVQKKLYQISIDKLCN